MMRTPKKCPARLIGVALLVSVSVSCGDDGRRDDQPTDRTADLRIAVGTDDAPDLSTATLAIRADGVATGTGYLAEPAAATRAAELLGDAAAAQRLVEGEPDDQACTEIYGALISQPSPELCAGRRSTRRFIVRTDAASPIGTSSSH
jgi:hypothetical protein